jgi:hypothetical protein
MRPLTISPNRRFLVHTDDGSPFFWLGDTAWELFHRLDLAEARHYLENRAAKGVTVIQAVALAELDGVGTPNANGDLPLHDRDPARPNEAYFSHVDSIVDLAASLGMYVALLPSWGDKVNPAWSKGVEPLFTPESGRTYGRFLGERYRDRPGIVWVVGGDRPVGEPVHAETWRAIAVGLAEGDGHSHLRTFHPVGPGRSSTDFHHDAWLDFNMVQSGHAKRDVDNAAMVAADYALSPVKPTLDAEPCYEDHPVGWDPLKGWFDDWDVRKAAYNAVFAGAFGHTYGCNNVWQMHDPANNTPMGYARHSWRETLDLPGAGQMRHLKDLLLSRPFLTRVPDQSLLADPDAAEKRVRATRDANGAYALVYCPSGDPVTVRLGGLGKGGALRASWFDPRTGRSEPGNDGPAGGEREFTPPSAGPGNDWVLVVE